MASLRRWLLLNGINRDSKIHQLLSFQMPKSPAIDDMAPQSISFIGDQDSVDLSSAHSMKIQQLFQPTSNHSKANALHSHQGDSQSNLEASLGKLNISSGSRTYRIPSPTRPVMNSKSFQVSIAYAMLLKRMI